MEHTHGLNKEKCQGGHYHYDTTPEEVEYTGYFNLAECNLSLFNWDKGERGSFCSSFSSKHLETGNIFWQSFY